MQTASNLKWPQAGWLGARLRLRERAMSLARRLSRKPAAPAGAPRGTLRDKLENLRAKYAKGA